MSRKLLCIFAHPDDESFGPGGTIAKYADKGVEVHLLMATRGEAGDSLKFLPAGRHGKAKSSKLKGIRERELRQAAEVLGIAKVEFLGARDGRICSALYHNLAEKIMSKIKRFSPQVVITFDRLGISGHLDHIGISMITTYAFLKTRIAAKLYYHCLRQESIHNMSVDDYYIYFPEGYSKDEITTTIDVSSSWEKKVEAMKKHKSQMGDVKRILGRLRKFPKLEYYILGHWVGLKPKFPENDLFIGI